MREIEQRAVAGQVERRWALKSGRLGHAWHLCQWIKWFNNPYFMVMSWHLTEIAHSKHMVLSLAHSSVQFGCSVVSHSLCNPMDCSTPGFPVHHRLPEPTQIHVHHIGDTMQQSHPLSSPSPPAFNLFQHRGLFQWVWFIASGGQSIGVSASASVLPMNIQDWFPLGWTGWISLPIMESSIT